jgi:hypothetical protein
MPDMAQLLLAGGSVAPFYLIFVLWQSKISWKAIGGRAKPAAQQKSFRSIQLPLAKIVSGAGRFEKTLITARILV